MLARDATLALIDFESTGKVSGYPDEPWQIGLARFEGGRVVARSFYDSLLRVGTRPFNPYAPGRHEQIRDEIAVAPTLASLWPVLRPRLEESPLCAHNVATEKRFLGKAFPLHPAGAWVDTLRLARIAWPDLPSHKLEDLLHVARLRDRVDALCPGREPHDALYDAVACGVLLEALLALPEWKEVTLEALVQPRITS